MTDGTVIGKGYAPASSARGRRLMLVGALLLAGLVFPAAAAPAQAAKKGGKAPVVRAGAASRSVLPLVDGSRDYLRAGLPSDDDAISPGVFVPEWDDGRIAVGNGDSVSHWVHDDLRVRALALSELSRKRVTVLLSADLYMIFRVDADSIREKVDERLPGTDVEVLVGSTHDTTGPTPPST